MQGIKKLVVAFCLFSGVAHALPIDWNGSFGVDTTLIDNFRRIKAKGDPDNTNTETVAGTQEVPLASGDHANASFQSYLFRLNPTLIVNDSASIKAEMTTGHGRGGFLGDDPEYAKEDGWANALYTQNGTSNVGSALTLSKFYAELYADTATYQIGRHSRHFALGAVINSGENKWDRHSFTQDGLTMKVKIGNFHIAPFWAKLDNGGTLTRATNVKQYGASMLYDNPDRDIAFGLLYEKKQSNRSAESDAQKTTIEGTSTNIGSSDVKLVDLYLKKIFGKFDFAVEVPIVSGKIGRLYAGEGDTSYKAKAYVLESNYKGSDAWSFGLNLGHVTGHSGAKSSFSAMYLNPNYQIANLLFRYNLRAVADPANKSIYDAYITNAKYARFETKYRSEKWLWTSAVVYAVANETAETGKDSFNHTNNKMFVANAPQSDKLGTEIDTDFDYLWNNEVTLNASFGYLFTGDYFAFSNDTTVKHEKQNSWVAQLGTLITF